MESESSRPQILYTFCQRLTFIANGSNPNQWAPELLAREFLRFFNLPSPVPLLFLRQICAAIGISNLKGVPMPANMRACHVEYKGRLEIYHTEGEWEGGIAFSVFHEVRERIASILQELNPRYEAPANLERQANQFAARILLERSLFRQKAAESGFNVTHLREFFGASYTSVLIRLTEVFGDELPLAAVAYENIPFEAVLKQRLSFVELKELSKRKEEFHDLANYQVTVSATTSYLKSLKVSHGEYQRLAPPKGTPMAENPWAVFAVTKLGGHQVRYLYKNIPSDSEGSEEQWMSPVTDVYLVRYFGILAKVLLVSIPLLYRYGVDPFFKHLQDKDFKRIRESMLQLDES